MEIDTIIYIQISVKITSHNTTKDPFKNVKKKRESIKGNNKSE